MSPAPHPCGPGSSGAAVEPDSEFLLHLCHDLRSCLRAIQPSSELLVKSAGDANSVEAAKARGFLLAGASRLDMVVQALAGYAIALQTDPAAFRLTSLEAVLRGSKMQMEKERPGGGLTLTGNPLPRVSGDSDGLRQLFDHLIRNAVVHGGQENVQVHVESEPHTEGWLISVRDNGRGIEPQYLERIFEPFHRLNPRAVASAGLGLTTCRVIVQRHGGRTWAQSEPPNGCIFRFTLPRAIE